MKASAAAVRTQRRWGRYPARLAVVFMLLAAATAAAAVWLVLPTIHARRLAGMSDAALVSYTVSNPRDVAALLALARRTETRGLNSEALTNYERVTQVEPRNAPAWANVARIALKQGDLIKARNAAQTVAKISPSEAAPLRDVAGVLKRMRDRNGARELLEKAVLVAPNDADSWDLLAVVQTERGSLVDAVRAARRATQIAPDRAQNWLHLATALRLSADMSGARSAIERATKLAPDDPEVLLEQGTLYAESGTTAAAQQATAEAAFLKASRLLRRTEREAEALRRLGQFYLTVNRLPEAQAVLEQCLKLAPADTTAMFSLSRTLALRGKPDQAAALMKRFTAQSDFDLTVRQLRMRMQREPQRADLPARLGDLYAAKGDAANARAAWLRSLQIDQAQPELRRRLARLP